MLIKIERSHELFAGATLRLLADEFTAARQWKTANAIHALANSMAVAEGGQVVDIDEKSLSIRVVEKAA